jgi:hypothetical protein
MVKSKNFIFDGGAATYFGTGILAFLITAFTAGLVYKKRHPYCLVMFL